MKKTLLLLHGALGSEKELIPLKKLLTETFDVRSFNFSGHGGEPHIIPLIIQ
jgi:esterase/lipase